MDGYISVGCVCGCVHHVLASFPGSCAHESLGTRLIMYVRACMRTFVLCTFVCWCMHVVLESGYVHGSINVCVCVSLVPRHSKNRRECLVHTVSACVNNSVILLKKIYRDM